MCAPAMLADVEEAGVGPRCGVPYTVVRKELRLESRDGNTCKLLMNNDSNDNNGTVFVVTTICNPLSQSIWGLAGCYSVEAANAAATGGLSYEEIQGYCRGYRGVIGVLYALSMAIIIQEFL